MLFSGKKLVGLGGKPQDGKSDKAELPPVISEQTADDGSPLDADKILEHQLMYPHHFSYIEDAYMMGDGSLRFSIYISVANVLAYVIFFWLYA